MDNNTFILLFGTLTTFGGGVITYLLTRINILEKEISELRSENQRLEGLLNDFLTTFLVLNKQSEKPLDDKVLALVIQTKQNLNNIQNKVR